MGSLFYRVYRSTIIVIINCGQTQYELMQDHHQLISYLQPMFRHKQLYYGPSEERVSRMPNKKVADRFF